ncbi:transthyretin-like [Spea bombifrons]|uniref:transthyretin-like n=1 Tax=Spea bombifrons TaxID=233779 RepID=UPI00234B9CBE|nr:transthyretin-like [Spea bombifrons]
MAYLKVFAFLAALIVLSEAAPSARDTNTASELNPLVVHAVNSGTQTPAANLQVTLFRQNDDGSFKLISSRQTAADGEISDFVTEEDFVGGVYKLQFATSAFWVNSGFSSFYEYVDVVFSVEAENHDHYDIDVFISPSSFSSTATVTDPHILRN